MCDVIHWSVIYSARPSLCLSVDQSFSVSLSAIHFISQSFSMPLSATHSVYQSDSHSACQYQPFTQFISRTFVQSAVISHLLSLSVGHSCRVPLSAIHSVYQSDTHSERHYQPFTHCISRIFIQCVIISHLLYHSMSSFSAIFWHSYKSYLCLRTVTNNQAPWARLVT